MRVILCLRANFYFFIPIFARYVYKNIKFADGKITN